jgi:hypothetical protein
VTRKKYACRGRLRVNSECTTAASNPQDQLSEAILASGTCMLIPLLDPPSARILGGLVFASPAVRPTVCVGDNGKRGQGDSDSTETNRFTKKLNNQAHWLLLPALA